jgi:hypothetical protein
MPERLLRRQGVEQTVTGLSLVSQALAFSIFGMLIVANRHQADLNSCFTCLVTAFWSRRSVRS